MDDGRDSGAYRLHISVPRRLDFSVGALGEISLPRGRYIYVGSAKRGLRARTERHRRLGTAKQGKLHWHVDYLLIQAESRLTRVERLPGGNECSLARALLARGAAVPVSRFGASDCTEGCPAHLFKLAPQR